MKIQFNNARNMTGSEEIRVSLIALMSEQLSRFSHNITRLEVHLSDENGPKEGMNDKRCMLEARLEGRQPIAVTNVANSFEQAANGAIVKLKNSLSSILGRLGRIRRIKN